MTIRKGTTEGNIWSMLTTVGMSLLTIATTLVAVTLAYGRLDAADRMHDRRLDVIEAAILRAQTDDRVKDNAAAERYTGIERRLATMEGDIRVVRQILEPPKSR